MDEKKIEAWRAYRVYQENEGVPRTFILTGLLVIVLLTYAFVGNANYLDSRPMFWLGIAGAIVALFVGNVLAGISSVRAAREFKRCAHELASRIQEDLPQV
jgi:uncharacterized membrane protein (DUF485 family)